VEHGHLSRVLWIAAAMLFCTTAALTPVHRARTQARGGLTPD
jgi:hypothetical protein